MTKTSLRPATRTRGRARARRMVAAWPLIATLAPLLLGIPVLSGVAESFVNLIGNEQPYLGYDSTATDIDGQAVFLGEALFRDPAEGYTGLPLPPLFPLILGALDQVSLWSGWGIVLSMAAGLGLSAMAARLAYRPAGAARAERLVAAAGAIGMAGIAWWLALFVPFNFLYTSRSDQFAWMLGIGGLLLLPGVGRSARTLIASVVLVSAAIWAKQPAVAAALAALAWLVAEALRGRLSWPRVGAFAGVLAALNGAGLLALSLLSSGWGEVFVLEIPSQELRDQRVLDATSELLTAAGPAASVAAVLWLGLRGGRSGSPAARSADRGDEGKPSAAGVLTVFLVVSSVVAVLSDLKQGSVHNQFIGVAWACALLAAIAWGRSLNYPRALAAGALAVGALFCLGNLDRARVALHDHLEVSMPPAHLTAFWFPVSPQLREWAEERRVYHPVYSDLGVAPRGEVYPSHVHIQDLLATGRQPEWLVRQFLNRRFDAVFLFEENLQFAIYASGGGRFEDRYLWKLNRVIRARYRAAPELPRVIRLSRLLPTGDYRSPALLVRRPGPERARWMRRCFGPLAVGGQEWEIGHGGGFWCRRPGTTSLRLRGTPAPVSEVRSAARPTGVSGRVLVTLPRSRGFAELACGSGDGRWRIRVREQGGAIAAVLLADNRSTQTVRLISSRQRSDAPRDPLRAAVELAPAARAALSAEGLGTIGARLPWAGCDSLSLRGSRDSSAVFDVGALRIR